MVHLVKLPNTELTSTCIIVLRLGNGSMCLMWDYEHNVTMKCQKQVITWKDSTVPSECNLQSRTLISKLVDVLKN